MKRVRKWLAMLAAAALGALATGALAAGAPVSVAPVLVPLAHSALVTVDATTDSGRLILRVQRTSDGAVLPGAQLEATLDGHALPLTPRPDGTWDASLGNLAPSPNGTLQITVAHDGLREVLSGRLPGGGPEAVAGGGGGAHAGGSGPGLFKAHKQLAWWILNIVVVLIGVIAVSRRMS
jgi:hypothetical protein